MESPRGIILMRHRSAEKGEDRIAEKLRNEAIIAADRLAKCLEEGGLKCPDLLRIEALGERGKSGEIREENGHLPAVHIPVWRIRRRDRSSFRPPGFGRRSASSARSYLGGTSFLGSPATGTECKVRLAQKAARQAGCRLSATAPRAEGEARC